MRRTIAPVILLALACAAAPLAGCRKSRTESADGNIGAAARGSGAEDPGVDAVVRQLAEFTEELAGKVERAEDPKAGVADAQRLLDARKGELAARISAFGKSPRAQEPGARGKWLEAENDSIRRLRRAQLKHMDASLNDPELKAGLERLVADYDSLFKER